ncbi:MAG: MHS family MFS transporter [Actinobacteria bacterium]|nr:MAG: MHS family MFS transporter [Actinomycetota bacterium]
MADTAAADADRVISPGEMRKIIAASSVGTMVEWYDFYIFGSLAAVIASKFYQTGTPLGDMIAWLAAFAIGFIVRPFGAIVFGRVGDLIGRKYTFLVTMTLMGICTFAVGCLPTIDKIGPAAGVILIFLRIMQGLALGGEYGGAATYIAEHAPHGKRGFYTSWIQITATAGLFMSLGIILATKSSMSVEAFSEWGWRIPFLVSILLIMVSLYIRISLRESPLFAKLKASGQRSKNPILESFGKKENLKWVLLALFGATMGQGVVWYTGQFYALFYLQKIFHVAFTDSNYIIGLALLAATPFFVVMGALSDKIGRKKIMLAGMLLAVLTYYPIYGLMAANAPASYKASADDVKGFEKTAKAAAAAGKDVPMIAIAVEGDTAATIAGATKVPITEIKKGDALAVKHQKFLFDYQGYNPFILWLCVAIQVIYVTMVYGPIAAFLVELFPTKIRYTSMSLPYHIGNGVFGGLVPIIGLSWVSAQTAAGNPMSNYAGLWWPMGVAGVCFVVGLFLVKDTHHIDIHAGESIAAAAVTTDEQPDIQVEDVGPDEL